MSVYYRERGTALVLGDCLEVMKKLPPNSVDSIITDPPYALLQASRRGSGRSNEPDNSFGRHGSRGGGFMGMAWDSGLPPVEVWEEALRVAKPGAVALVFGGTRTFHRLACAIEDAGWEIRDSIGWNHSEPVFCQCGLSSDESGTVAVKWLPQGGGAWPGCPRCSKPLEPPFAAGPLAWNYGTGFPKSLDISKAIETMDSSVSATDAARTWDGYGTALKPAWEPIIVAMKPLDGTFAENAQKHGVAGLNIDGCRIETATEDDYGRSAANSEGVRVGSDANTYGKYGDAKAEYAASAGRWPANVLLDTDAADALDAQAGELTSGRLDRSAITAPNKKYGARPAKLAGIYEADSGGPSRFFYTAKASKKERGEGNTHPTVKPLKLMQWLVKLTKPPGGGVVLDPFVGSGTTALACENVGRKCIGIDLSEEYLEIAKRRLEGLWS